MRWVMILATSLTQAPGKQHTSLWDGSEQHVVPSVPLRRESPMMTALLFSWLSCSKMGSRLTSLGQPLLHDGHAPTSTSPSPFSSRASYLFCKGTWEGGTGWGVVCLLPQTGTCFHPLLSSRSPLPTWLWDSRWSSTAWGASSPCPSCRDGRVQLHQSIPSPQSQIQVSCYCWGLELTTPEF